MLNLRIVVYMPGLIPQLEQLVKRAENALESIETESDDMMFQMASAALENWESYSHPYETGNLRSSIRVEGEFPSYILLADAVDKYGVQYAGFLEYGTSTIAAMPYMMPAVHETIAEYVPIIREKVLRSLREE